MEDRMRIDAYRRRERDAAMVALRAAGVPHETVRLVLRDAAKLARLAEAACNGDWPADGGSDRWKTAECKRCGSFWAPSTLKGKDAEGHPLCEDCRAADRITARLATSGIVPDFAGDPRGFVVKVKVPTGRPAPYDVREVGLA